MSLRRATACVATMIVAALSNRASAQTSSLTGFETPDITDNFQYNPVDPNGVQYVGLTGITDPPSGFDSLAAPQGTQYAFIQQGNGTNAAGGSYLAGGGALPVGTQFSLSFLLAGRNDGHAANPIIVQVNGVNSTPITPVVSQFNTYSVGPFTSVGNNIVYFIGQGTGADSTSFLDDLKVTIVPEPASVSALAVGFIGIGLRRRSVR